MPAHPRAAAAVLAITRAREAVVDDEGLEALEARLGAVAMSAIAEPAAG